MIQALFKCEMPRLELNFPRVGIGRHMDFTQKNKSIKYVLTEESVAQLPTTS